MNDPVLLCCCACPDAASAQAIADVVGERLAACVNAVPGVASTYRWQGRVTTDSEVLLLIKTTAGALQTLTRRVLALHPYELPEVIAVPVTAGHAAYLDWVRANVATQGRSANPAAGAGP
jgi:periplasmic divalent cation tolerance protein